MHLKTIFAVICVVIISNILLLNFFLKNIDNILVLFIISLSEAFIIYIILRLEANKIKVSIAHLNNFIKDLDNIKNFQVNIHNTEFGEFTDLVISLDNMISNYKRTNTRLSYEKRKAELILSYLEQGIIILDNSGIILEANNYMQKLGIDVTEGENIEHLLSNYKFKNMINIALQVKNSADCEFQFGSEILYFKIKPLIDYTNKYGYMLSIRDITSIRKFDDMKYEFVSNVTHELKTPLTSIKGFVETLKLGAIQNEITALRFLDIIEIEANRLSSLIEDILLLSDIEQSENLIKENFNLKKIALEVISLLEPVANKKGLIIVEKLEDIDFYGDPNHFKQIMINLLGNAIKYTEKGHIDFIIEKNGNKMILIVKDTGIGIAPIHINRIFERFYRIDKSRSRQSGGTGLGLSIVKHLILLYNGKVTVESKIGKGTTFIIKFNF
ncbi:hypothetical protein AN641_09470 [Candidatus Epulonipiscioides gigas]|nr:hypothetical protein AN641_09470 [Epulopiscium sp. SCG-C07WGA-EpuloA2]